MQRVATRIFGIMILFAIFFGLTSMLVKPALAAGDETPGVQVDGLLDAEYSHLATVPVSTGNAPGDLYGYESATQCYWAFVVDRSFNDNVYSQSDTAYLLQDGWTHAHDFKALEKSDHAVFDVAYGNNQSFSVYLDYVNQNGNANGGYLAGTKSGQLSDGYNDGYAPQLSAEQTSIHWNILHSGWQSGDLAAMLTQSPPYNYNDSGDNYWEWQLIYEFSIAKSTMGGACGTVTEGGAHNSPTKADTSALEVGDYVWLDANKNGIQDDGGPAAGVDNVTVYLRDATTNAIIRTTQTSPAGYYIFTNLTAGTYYVDFELPNGYLFTTRNVGANDAVDSDADLVNGTTASFALQSVSNLTLDAGLVVPTPPAPSIVIKKYTNGEDADTPTGPLVPVGGQVTWTYVVTNTGDVPLTSVAVTDDKGVSVSCPKNTLAVDETMTCTASGTAVAGQYANIGSVTGKPPTGSNVMDTDPSHYFGVTPNISHSKSFVNATKQSNGSWNVQYSITVVNAGGAAGQYSLADQPSFDNDISINSASFTSTVPSSGALAGTGPWTLGTNVSLGAGASHVYILKVNVSMNLEGGGGNDIYTPCKPLPGGLPNQGLFNRATLTQPGKPATTADACGDLPAIKVTKYTNGEDADVATGPLVPAGGQVTWTYVVVNTGGVNLTKVAVTDDKGVSVSCPKNTLAVGETMTCTASGTAVAGQYANIGTVKGTSPSDEQVTDDNPSHYFGVAPGIDIIKYTNGQDADTPTGPLVPIGATVTWTYVVHNTGNVPLTKVAVTDDKGVSVSCPKSVLAVDETMTCTASGIAVAGQYANVGTVVGTSPLNEPVTDKNPSHYYGVVPGIEIIKYTNDEDADTPTGPIVPVGSTVTWTYVVHNTGNAPLSNITVTDNMPGVEPVYVSGDVNNNKLLDVSEVWTYTASGVAIAGQYGNVGTVEGTSPGGEKPKDDNPSHYFGSVPAIDIIKYTNGQDADTAPGPLVPIGAAVTWSYVVHNTGNVPLSNVAVTDDKGVSVSCPKNTLAVDETMTCTATGTAVAGQYGNVGTVKGTSPLNEPVTDTNPSHYFGVVPGIEIKKYTNGADADTPTGPIVPVGSTVTWTYVVHNRSNVALSNITVTDNIPGVKPVYVSGDVNNNKLLDVNEVWTYTASGIAIAGQYGNVGTVEGTTPEGEKPKDDDPSHYFGSTPAIEIKKYTNGQDADTGTGPLVPIGAVVTWTYVVHNTGNVPLSSITVTDNMPGVKPVYVSGDTNHNNVLDLKEVWTYSASGVAVAGQYGNVGTVTGTSPVGEKPKDDNPSHYFGLGTALGDFVWEDLNANGLQDAGEPGVPGAVVHLLAGNCTTSLGQTTTDKNGIYFFPDLTPGSYCVQFDLPPNNALFTTKDAGDDARDSDAGTDGKSAPVTVVGGQPNLTVDAGLVIKSLSIKADPLCELDAPYLSYTVTPVNFTPGANPVTVRWRSADSAATVLYTMANLPLSGKLLWPEAGVDAQQHGNKWPGWSYDSTTQEWTDNGSQLRPNVKVEFSVNPTATVTVTYPPANPTCNPGPETNPTDLPSGEQPGQRVPSVFLPDVRGN